MRDHVVPLRDGGEESVDNEQPLCRWCHAVKTAGETRARRRQGGGGHG